MTQQNGQTNFLRLPRTSAGQRRFFALLILTALVIGGNCSADNELKPATEDAALTASEQTKSEKQCTWACQRWTKLCNVDPRGVYKCRRSCADFGEVCEE